MGQQFFLLGIVESHNLFSQGIDRLHQGVTKGLSPDDRGAMIILERMSLLREGSIYQRAQKGCPLPLQAQPLFYQVCLYFWHEAVGNNISGGKGGRGLQVGGDRPRSSPNHPFAVMNSSDRICNM